LDSLRNHIFGQSRRLNLCLRLNKIRIAHLVDIYEEVILSLTSSKITWYFGTFDRLCPTF
jgi:hypothetical protein